MKLHLYDLGEIKDRLKDQNLMQISRSTGISYPTIYAFARGVEKDFRMKTMMQITEYLTLEDNLQNMIDKEMK
jgi:hypothetical protein